MTKNIADASLNDLADVATDKLGEAQSRFAGIRSALVEKAGNLSTNQKLIITGVAAVGIAVAVQKGVNHFRPVTLVENVTIIADATDVV